LVVIFIIDEYSTNHSKKSAEKYDYNIKHDKENLKEISDSKNTWHLLKNGVAKYLKNFDCLSVRFSQIPESISQKLENQYKINGKFFFPAVLIQNESLKRG
jgi:hypothetical protein